MIKLNYIDWAIIYFLGKESQGVGELQRKLRIAPVNVHKHLLKLKSLKIISLDNVGRGKKKSITLVRLELMKIAYNMRINGVLL